MRIVVPGLGTLSRQVEAGSGVNNQNDLTLHFGLGNYTGPLALEIFWPDGFTSQHSASVDTSITIAYPLVSLVEFSSFVNEWLNTNCNAGNDWCNGYDYDQNQSVDIDDLITFANDKWLSY